MVGLSAALDWLDRQANENLAELVKVLGDELQYRGSQVQELIRTHEAHRKFVSDDLPGLLLYAMRKSEEQRDRERIARLARILVHAAEVGLQTQADYVEEMLRIATNLDTRDVLVLGQIVSVQSPSVQKEIGRVKQFDAYYVTRQIRDFLSGAGFLEGEVDSISAKLESFGLVSRAERSANSLGDDPIPYALLQKGLDFVNYIKSAHDLGLANTAAS